MQNTIAPKEVIILIGFIDRLVTPSHARPNIFLSGYLLSPASLSLLSYSTTLDLKPTSGTRPLRNRLTSLNSAKAFNALLLINLKSAWL